MGTISFTVEKKANILFEHEERSSYRRNSVTLIFIRFNNWVANGEVVSSHWSHSDPRCSRAPGPLVIQMSHPAVTNRTARCRQQIRNEHNEDEGRKNECAHSYSYLIPSIPFLVHKKGQNRSTRAARRRRRQRPLRCT